MLNIFKAALSSDRKSKKHLLVPYTYSMTAHPEFIWLWQIISTGMNAVSFMHVLTYYCLTWENDKSISTLEPTQYFT